MEINDTQKKKKGRKVRIDRGEWIPVFLGSLRSHGVVRLACQQAQIERGTAYKMREADAKFANSWDEAIEEATDTLVAVARQRALNGSDRLLEFLLKAHRPEVYRDAINVENKVVHDFEVDFTPAVNPYAKDSNKSSD